MFNNLGGDINRINEDMLEDNQKLDDNFNDYL